MCAPGTTCALWAHAVTVELIMYQLVAALQEPFDTARQLSRVCTAESGAVLWPVGRLCRCMFMHGVMSMFCAECACKTSLHCSVACCLSMLCQDTPLPIVACLACTSVSSRGAHVRTAVPLYSNANGLHLHAVQPFCMRPAVFEFGPLCAPVQTVTYSCTSRLPCSGLLVVLQAVLLFCMHCLRLKLGSFCTATDCDDVTPACRLHAAFEAWRTAQ